MKLAYLVMVIVWAMSLQLAHAGGNTNEPPPGWPGLDPIGTADIGGGLFDSGQCLGGIVLGGDCICNAEMGFFDIGGGQCEYFSNGSTGGHRPPGDDDNSDSSSCPGAAHEATDKFTCTRCGGNWAWRNDEICATGIGGIAAGGGTVIAGGILGGPPGAIAGGLVAILSGTVVASIGCEPACHAPEALPGGNLWSPQLSS